VVKVSPPPGTALLTYERDLMRTEGRFYALAARDPSVPLPTLIHAGFDRRVVDRDYLVLSTLGGQPWNAVEQHLSPPERRSLRTELGRHVAALHRITGDTFGYPQRSTGLQGDTWREAFTAMVSAVLDDAGRFGVALPVPAATIGQLVSDHADALDVVRTPVLTHFDLWEGNVFVTGAGDGGPRIEGLIDAERAFWGDPQADLVSLFILRDVDGDDAFLVGYREAGGHLELDAPLRRRLHLYRVYLDLIMLVEAVPRGYDPAAHAPIRMMCEAHLRRELRALTDST
jgi:aminoglycoside phosphotransferase (APT) family kinase protein